MARRSIYDELDEETTIDLSPMIDCIFILLIFFIVTTVFVEEKGLQAAKPDAAAAVSLEDSETVTLRITAENKILFEGKQIAIGEVDRKVRARAGDGETPVVIEAHEKSDHGVFVAVWDAARRGGAEQLSFNTVD